MESPDARLGWHELDMDEICRLIRFARNSSEIQAVFDVCYNSLLSGDILIEHEHRKVKASASRESAEEEIKAKKRSSMFGEWAWNVSLLEDAIGFAPTVVVPNEDALTATDDPYKPATLNMDKLKIFHRVDVFSRHHWEFFEVRPNAFPQLVRIDGVTVIGSKNLPDSNGVLCSKVKRLLNGIWTLYQAKLFHTLRADRERSHPTLITQDHDPKPPGGDHMASAAHPSFNQMTPAQMESSERALRVHALVKAKNTGNDELACLLQTTDMSLAQAEQQVTRAGAKPAFAQFSIDPGKAYVSAHLPEAPIELLPVRQAFLEMVCLESSVPMSMLSAGDSSGKAKLNSQTASPETARIFREAQAARKRRVESFIADFYSQLYGEEAVENFVRQQVEREVKGKKRKHVDISLEDMARHAKVRVQIPANPQFETLMLLYEKGVLKHEAFCAVVANQMCMSIDSFEEKPPPTEHENAMELQAAKPTPTSKPKPKAKKK